MKAGGEKLLCRDKYGNKILLHKNQLPGYDLQTDGRVFLSRSLARELAEKLLKLADRELSI
jgi:hypothetical protein